MGNKQYLIKFAALGMKLCSKVIPKKNKVVFISFNGKGYNDNPKAVSEALHEISPDTEIVWLFNDPENKASVVPDYVRCSLNRYRNLIRELIDAKVWVNSFLFPNNIYKNKNQMYINTWHGDRAFKKILYDKSKKHAPLFEEKNANYIIAGSTFGEQLIRSAFGYEGEILKVGCPRNDKLINYSEAEYERIKEKLNIPKDTKIFLYAPTFREHARGQENRKQSLQGIDLKQTLELLKKKFDSDWVCLVRAHKSGNGIVGVAYDDKIINVTEYDDMADLLLVADLLITDYSSSYGDFALKKRSLAILFQDDREEYSSKERAFYYDLEKTPFKIAQSQEELNSLISEFDINSIEAHNQEILNFYGCYEDGKASEKIAQLISDFIHKKV